MSYLSAETSGPKNFRALLLAARDLISAGRLDEARQALDSLRADAEAMKSRALGEMTLLGYPRKLHSAYLKLAKAERDIVRRVGLQHSLVPPPQAMAALGLFDPAERRVMTELARAPVPRIIHQIWLGTLPVPPSVERWAIHAEKTGFEYRLWREADLEKLGADAHPSYLRMLEIGDYPGAVDIARYAILQALGGVYLDCDWYPTRDNLGFADLLPLIGLGAMAEVVPRETGFGSLLLANSFIAAPPGHPVFRRMLETIPDIVAKLPDAPAWWSTGPLAMTVAFRQTSTFVAPADLVAAELPRGAPISDVEAACKAAVSGGGDGLLIAWKSW